MKYLAVVIVGFVLCGAALAQPLPDDAATADELALPAVPSTLTTPAHRAAFIIEHFWDNLDFATDSRANDAAFVEQTFVNFLSVFPYADTTAQRTAVNTLMHSAEANPSAFRTLTDLADKYLYEYESPMADDALYAMFAENVLSSAALDDAHKIRPRAHLDAALKNRPGTLAADFAFTDRDGRDMTLYAIDAPGDILLIFYDPDCDHCRETMDRLQADTDIAAKIAAHSLTVVAIYSGDEHDLWYQRAQTIPANWIVGYDDGTLQEDGRYVIRNLPTLYRLSSDKKVIEKEIR